MHQPWIGAWDALPGAIDPAYLTEIDTGTTRPLRSRGRPRLEGHRVRAVDEPSLSFDEIATLARRARGEEEPDAASAFLADAYHAAFCTFPRDLKRAVLLAAFACEIRMRDMLRTCLRPGAEQRFDQWFPEEGGPRKRLREWPGPVAKELVGRSLEDEDPDLFEQFGTLIDMRNSLAHRGVVPAVGAALEGVRAARRVFRWLDDVTRT